MKLIGLVGESPNDTNAVKSLLERYYPDKFQFITLLDNVPGSLLDHQKTKRLLEKDFLIKKPEQVIFIRDLDGLETDKEKLALRKRYFAEFRSVVGHRINKNKPNRNSHYLLHIWEIEALIHADAAGFNAIYATNLPQVADPMKIEGPKEELQRYSRYNESDCEECLIMLDLNQIRSVRYMAQFLTNFEKVNP